VKKPKVFDCVEMKSDIQRKLQAEFSDMPEMEKRCLHGERVRQNPALGPLIEKFRVVRPDRPSH
jgi:hypothetical protein